MREPSPTVRASSVLVVLLFFAAAAAISFLSLQRGTDYITLTINDEWRIYLIEESNVYAVEYRADDFTQEKLDSHHLWLQGYGDINWHGNTIRVRKTGISFNKILISKSQRDTLANILFARDGTVRKGMLETRTSN
jgi:nuclear transport factor 2 (NTF2) superfamily protein